MAKKGKKGKKSNYAPPAEDEQMEDMEAKWLPDDDAPQARGDASTM